MHACSEGKLLGAEKGCPGVWYSLVPLPLWQVPDSSCSRSVPRVFLALVEEAEDRGGVVAQGGGKVRGQASLCCWPVPRRVAVVWQEGTLAPSYRRRGEAGAAVTWLLRLCLQALIPLSLEGTEVGQTKAAQALAKITITSNPEMAFPGERVSVAAVGTGLPSRGPVRAVGAVQGLAWEQQWGRGCSRGSPHCVLPGCCSQACVCSGEASG